MSSTREPSLNEVLQTCADDVYEQLGNGLTECNYRNALAQALRKVGNMVNCEVVIPVTFNEATVGSIRADIIVGDFWVIEIKCASKITETHCAQTRAYMSRMHVPKPGQVYAHVVNFGLEGFEIKEVKLPSKKRKPVDDSDSD